MSFVKDAMKQMVDIKIQIHFKMNLYKNTWETGINNL